MENIFIFLEKMSLKICKSLTNLSSIAMFIWPLVIVIYIILRYLGIAWVFVEEFTEYWLILIVFFPLGYALKTKSHLSIDIAVKHLPQKIRKILGLITTSLSFLVVINLLKSSMGLVKYGIEHKVCSTYPSHLLLGPIYSIIPIGLFSLGLEIFLEIYYKLKELCSK